VTEKLQERITAALGDQYDVETEIGRGGMSIVFRALDRRLRRHVAIKVLPPEFAFDSAVRERFRREAQTAAQLNHPNIVPIHSVDEKDGIAFFAMTLCEGDSLAARLARVARPPVDEVRRVMCEVADALAYAHARGVVHRDIKPDNILLDRDSGRAMVTDFGIARAAEAGSRLTVTGIAVGTPAYMSPEQALGEHEIDGRSDIYSLGVVGYQMLAGVTPFVANNTPSMLMKHVSELPMPLIGRRRDVPPDLALAIERALVKRPDDRWQTALEMRDVLAGRQAPVYYAVRGDLASARALENSPHRSPPAAPPAPPLSAKESKRARRQRKQELRHRPYEVMTIEERIHKLRHRLVTYSGTSAMLLGINVMTGGGEPWFLIPTAVLAADVLRRFGGLWADGISMSEVFRRPRPRNLDLGSSLTFPGAALSAPGSYGQSSGAEPLRMASGGSRAASAPEPLFRSPINPLVDGAAASARAPSPREVRDQLRAAAQLRDDVEEDRRVWGQATSLRKRFVRFRQQVLVTASFATLSMGLAVMSTFDPFLAPGVLLSLLPVALFGQRVVRQARSLKRDNVEPTDVLLQPLDTLVREFDPGSLMGGLPGFAGGRPEAQSPYMEAVHRATADRAAILDAIRRMSKVDRRLLPDVGPTVNALVDRIASLAPTLHRLDADLRPNNLEALEARIAEAESHHTATPESDRKLALLQRQRTSLQDLINRREVLLGQLESAALLLQNLKLDLIKVRSVGVQASVQGVNNATQEARALSAEIGYVLGAADEIRKL
jgi:serine/threonine-protein kinase